MACPFHKVNLRKEEGLYCSMGVLFKIYPIGGINSVQMDHLGPKKYKKKLVLGNNHIYTYFECLYKLVPKKKVLHF